MPVTLASLQSDRSKLQEEFLRLGDLRPGSITATVRKCGKPSCHCAKPNDPGHAPQFRLTRKVGGKTVTESFPNPAALRKAQQEVSEFHRLQKLNDELISINEKICDLRPVEQQRGGWTEQEKNGCCNPSGDCAGSKPTAEPHIRRTAQQRPNRSGSRGKCTASSSPPSWRLRLERTAAVPSPGSGSASAALSLWTLCRVSGTTLQAGTDGSGTGTSLASLLFVPELSSRPVSGRRGTGH